MKEELIVYFKILFQHSLEGSHKNRLNLWILLRRKIQYLCIFIHNFETPFTLR